MATGRFRAVGKRQRVTDACESVRVCRDANAADVGRHPDVRSASAIRPFCYPRLTGSQKHDVTEADNPRFDTPTGKRSLRGRTLLCHDSYCNRYRVAARSSNTPTTSASAIGFRVPTEAGRGDRSD